MFRTSDILAFLDRIPIWKRIKALPDRVDELEKRLASLEAKPNVRLCRICKKEMSVTKVTALGRTAGKRFVPNGNKRIEYRCPDGHDEIDVEYVERPSARE